VRVMPRERMKALHCWSKTARAGAIGGDESDGEIESRARELSLRMKAKALRPIAPNVSSEKGTRGEEREVGVLA